MNYCIECGGETSSDERCEQCGGDGLLGAKLFHKDGKRYCEKCSTVYKWSMWKCVNCGEIFVNDYYVQPEED